ncbi:hypothetical protein BCR43DRAFT_490036 [Syncephalastrum racemosum]|uniref:Uncharacterized protein n=1 Tax=Syncephalastrum racemosum TaxID=13706 RepID=A0A1X2HF70_SYNRA|nr:hypothetical protein BCR43DRAFT_490036 [Syncephalastrum racemosum]
MGKRKHEHGDRKDTKKKKKKHKHRHHSAPHSTPILQLPYELLMEVFVLSSNPSLVVASRHFYSMLQGCSERDKVRWLLYRHEGDCVQAARACLRFPFVTPRLLSLFDSLNQEPVPLDDAALPPHLFKPPVPIDFLQLLLSRRCSPTKPKGYPLVKAAQLNNLDLAKILVAHGADPSAKDNFALRIAACNNNRDMVLYFLNDLRLTPDEETLRLCIQRDIWPMVDLLVQHGAVPDMATVLGFS